MKNTAYRFGQFTVEDLDYYFYNGKYYVDNGTVSKVISIEQYKMAYINTI